jgi:tripartite ATP-independent transporter DctP family solute receptor
MRIITTLRFWRVSSCLAFGLYFLLNSSQAGALAETADSKIVYRFSGIFPLGHFMTRTQEYFARLVQERTGGRVTVEVYPAGQLFQDKDMPKALPSGATDMSVTNVGVWGGLIPPIEILEIPFLYKDRDHLYRSADSPAVRQILGAVLEKQGIKLLFWIDFGGIAFVGKKPLRTMEDFKGKRIRSSGAVATEIIQALGAAPLYMSTGEVYLALQRGTIDGVHTSTCTVLERKQYEVARYNTHMEVWDNPSVILVMGNLRRWNELPPDIQKVMTAAAKETQEWGNELAVTQTKECLRELKERGMEIIYLPEKEKKRWAEATRNIKVRYLERTGETGKRLMEEVEKIR